MAEFRPIYPSHSIERCAVGISFSEDLPDKAFRRALDSVNPAIRNAGLQGQRLPGFQIDLAGGRLSPIGSGVAGPSQFVSPDRSTSLVIAPNQLIFQTGKYVRWAPFAGQIESLLLPAAEEFSNSLNLTAVQLEYFDTFVWDGNWSDFNWRDLLNPASGYLAQVASQAPQQWHTNSGWFDFLSPTMRVLTKVEVQVIERTEPGQTPTPGVGITTMMKQEVFGPFGQPVTDSIPSGDLIPMLTSMHDRLKNLFKTIITDKAASRVGL